MGCATCHKYKVQTQFGGRTVSTVTRGVLNVHNKSPSRSSCCKAWLKLRGLHVAQAAAPTEHEPIEQSAVICLHCDESKSRLTYSFKMVVNHLHRTCGYLVTSIGASQDAHSITETSNQIMTRFSTRFDSVPRSAGQPMVKQELIKPLKMKTMVLAFDAPANEVLAGVSMGKQIFWANVSTRQAHPICCRF